MSENFIKIVLKPVARTLTTVQQLQKLSDKLHALCHQDVNNFFFFEKIITGEKSVFPSTQVWCGVMSTTTRGSSSFRFITAELSFTTSTRGLMIRWDWDWCGCF